jgi:homoserine kinase
MTHRPHDPGVRVFAPATIANLGPGFDVLGLALAAPGDTVTARRSGTTGVSIVRIDGDGGLLSTDPAKNTAGIAAARTLRAAGIDAGVELEDRQRASDRFGAGQLGRERGRCGPGGQPALRLTARKLELVGPCLDAEAAVAGRHADNVAPSLLGGLMLVRSVDPLDLVRLPVPEGLTLVVVTPEFRLDTKESRAALHGRSSCRSRCATPRASPPWSPRASPAISACSRARWWTRSSPPPARG